MQKISIKREQSQAGLSFAKREKFRPQVKNKLLLLLVLLMTAATGAWAQEPATTYTAKMKDGTQDAKNWTIASGDKSATGDAADGLTGLSKKDAVTLTYGGRLKVKSVTATTDAEPPAPVEGKFTINANGDQVIFAKGNLQAKTEDYGANWTWGFAEHQYDYIGNAVANTSINGNGTVSTNGTVDLFGWVGTSGNLTGIAEYGISNVGYETAADAYGYQTTDQLKHDWGELIGDGNTWRVLTAAEWDYITHKRKDKQGSDVDRYAKATVNGVPGLILFPDEYEHVATPPTNINVNSKSAKFGDNQYDLAAWTLMENAGCIFLPASASRSKNVVSITTNYERGGYWTSTPHKTDGQSSYVMWFNYQSVGSAITEKSGRYYGNAVRLVKSATAQTAWDGDLSKLTAESTEKYATATDGMTITGTLAANVKVSIADGATVTLDNAVINGWNNDNYKWAGITCLGDATIILKDNTENTVKGFDAYYPGIQPAVGHKLIIKGGDQGTGKLTASSNGWAAGIGSGYGSGRPCGSIEIQGGNITATGGTRAAGIGSAYGGTCGDITIANTVTKVTAVKGTNAPYSIGKGDAGTCGTVTIGGTKYWENNAAVGDGDTYLAQATTEYPAAPTGNIVDLSTLTADYEAQNGDVLTGVTTSYKVTIAAGATVTLDGLTISGSKYCIKCLGDATIILKDGSTNTLTGTGDSFPALSIGDANTTLTIQGSTGVLNVESGDYCAGIGGGYSNTNSTCGNIRIEGGVITAQGGAEAAGIGSDSGPATCGDIIITGGTITAKGGTEAAGIGSGSDFGYEAVCGNITIANTVTKVTATKGSSAPYSIGKGDSGNCTIGTVTIGGTKYWENNAAVNGGDTYLATSPLIYEPSN